MKCKDCGKVKICPGLHTGPHKNYFRQKTNADRIREMNDAELELFLPNWSYTNACKAGEHDYAGCDNECEKCVAEWLKQPYTGKERYMQ